jgi:hypothetical protein
MSILWRWMRNVKDLRSSQRWLWKILYLPSKVNRRFGEICHFLLQCRRINQAGNQHETGNKQSCPPKPLLTSENRTLEELWKFVKLILPTRVKISRCKFELQRKICTLLQLSVKECEITKQNMALFWVLLTCFNKCSESTLKSSLISAWECETTPFMWGWNIKHNFTSRKPV